MAMMARRWVPSPTFLSSSCASTLNRSLRPSTSSSSARTVTFLPFGVAPKCLTLTSKPTVVCPSGRCFCTASMPARSIKPIIDGVDSTPSPPMCLTTSLSSTVVTISALSLGGGVGRGIDRALQAALRGDVDDAALPACHHRRVDRLGHEEHALQVHRDDAVELLLGIGFEWLANVHSCVVEQDVERPELARR